MIARITFVGLLGTATLTSAQNPAILAMSTQQISQIDNEIATIEPLLVDAAEADEAFGYGIIRTFVRDDGSVACVTNARSTHSGAFHESFYYAPNGILIATYESEQSDNDSQKFYQEEWTYFREKAFYATRSKKGTFPTSPDEPINTDSLESFTTPASEIETRALGELYRTAVDRGDLMIRVTHAFAGDAAPLDLDRVLLDTLSPSGHYVAVGRSSATNPNRIIYELAQTVDGQILGKLFTGLPEGNHIDYQAHWNTSEDFLIFRFDTKWTTMEAPIYRIHGMRLGAVGDLAEAAQSTALAEIKRAKHPYGIASNDIHGFTNVLSVESDDRVHLILESSSKVEGPETNVRTEMTLSFPEGHSMTVAGVRLLALDEAPHRVTDSKK